MSEDMSLAEIVAWDGEQEEIVFVEGDVDLLI